MTKDKTFIFRLGETDRECLNLLAEHHGVTRAGLIRLLLETETLRIEQMACSKTKAETKTKTKAKRTE